MTVEPNTFPTNNNPFPEETHTLPGASYPSSDDGWGRRRDGGDAPRPNKAKGSWKFARRSLSHNIQIDPKYDTPYRPPPQPALSPATTAAPSPATTAAPSSDALVENNDDAASTAEAMVDGKGKGKK